MKVRTPKGSKHYQTVWFERNVVHLIDQPKLPFKFQIFKSRDYKTTTKAITDMIVRGAPAIGATAGFAAAQAALEFKGTDIKKFQEYMHTAGKHIKNARPTAADLAHAVDRVSNATTDWDKIDLCKNIAVEEAQTLARESVEACKKIGEHGNEIIGDSDKILTHCNAGWLATVDWGTALAPIFMAKRASKQNFIWVDETRPRLQGARLTAWELAQEKINHSIIVDNAAGYYMQKDEVDLVITGADRVVANGDAANKIGTYEKAVLAKENAIPFYIAAPRTTFDLKTPNGAGIPIEERSADEVKKMFGKEGTISVANPISKAMNPAFDITPAKYVKGYITEFGILKPKDFERVLR